MKKSCIHKNCARTVYILDTNIEVVKNIYFKLNCHSVKDMLGNKYVECYLLVMLILEKIHVIPYLTVIMRIP